MRHKGTTEEERTRVESLLAMGRRSMRDSEEGIKRRKVLLINPMTDPSSERVASARIKLTGGRMFGC